MGRDKDMSGLLFSEESAIEPLPPKVVFATCSRVRLETQW